MDEGVKEYKVGEEMMQEGEARLGQGDRAKGT